MLRAILVWPSPWPPVGAAGELAAYSWGSRACLLFFLATHITFFPSYGYLSRRSWSAATCLALSFSPASATLCLISTRPVLRLQPRNTPTSEFNFEVRQIKLQISSSLQRKRHFCFDANPYAKGRWGLCRNRNVWRAVSSDLSHFELESTYPNQTMQLTATARSFENTFDD